MIIYNVTVTVEDEILDEWMDWMKRVHIPEVMATGCFESYRFCRIVKHSQDGSGYSIQYATADMATLHQYQIKHAPKLQADTKNKFQEKVLAFRTLLEVID